MSAPMASERRSAQPDAGVVTVTLTFDLPLSAVKSQLGDDFGDQRDHGITVESVAEGLLRSHRPERGYVRWSLAPSHGGAR